MIEAAVAVLLAIFGGIVSIHVRLTRLETKMEDKVNPMWEWFITDHPAKSFRTVEEKRE